MKTLAKFGPYLVIEDPQNRPFAKMIRCDDLDDVNSDPDAEERDPEDDTIGFPGDEMADWPLEGEEDDEDESD